MAGPLLTRRAAMLTLASAAVPAGAKAGTVEIGVCRSLDDFAKAAEFGFDYFEPPAYYIAGLTDTAFADLREQVLASRIRCKRCNRLIWAPDLPRLSVVGPGVNLDALTGYLSSTMDRCRQLGTELVVWGSPASRKVPESFSRDEAWQQIKTFLYRAGEVARSKKMLFAIEPIHRPETNTLNTGAETLRMLSDVNHPNVKMILDNGHMHAEHEDPEIVKRAGDKLVHFHFSGPNGKWPKTSDEDPEGRRMLAYIKETKFRGGISIGDSARGTFEDDAAASLEFFRKALS